MNLTNDQLDVFTEIINIGAGRAAATLSSLTGSEIQLTIPRVEVCDSATFRERMVGSGCGLDTAVMQEFQGGVSGHALLAFPSLSAIKLANVIGQVDQTDDELDLDMQGILEEIGNIHLNAVLGSMANLLGLDLNYSLPKLFTQAEIADLASGSQIEDEKSERTILIANTNFVIASRDIDGSLILAFEVGCLDKLLAALFTAYTI